MSHLGRVIASCGDDSMINFQNYSLDYISSIEDSDLKGYSITSLSFSNNSKLLAYSSNVGHAKIWDLATSTTVLNSKLSNDYPTSICYNLDNTLLSVATFNGELLHYSVPTFTQSSVKLKTNSKINMIKYSPFLANYIGFCSDDGSLQTMDLSSGQLVNNFASAHAGAVTGICFSPINSAFCASCGIDGKINFYDILAKKMVKSIPIQTSFTSLSFNIDGQNLACGNGESDILLFDLRMSSTPKAILTGNKGRVNYLEFCKKPPTNRSNSSVKPKTEASNVKSNSIDSTYMAKQGDIRPDNKNDKLTTNVNKLSSSIGKLPLNTKDKNISSVKDALLLKEGKEVSTMKNNPEHPPMIINANSLINSQNSNSQSHNISVPALNLEKLPGKNFALDANTPANEKMMIDTENIMSVKAKKFPTDLFQQPFPVENSLMESNVHLNNSNTAMNMMNINSNNQNQNQTNNNLNDLDLKNQNYIKKCFEAEMFKIKQFIHEEINTLHVDLIRQFEIQHAELIRSLKNFSNVNSKMEKEMDKLKKENENLKSQFF